MKKTALLLLSTLLSAATYVPKTVSAEAQNYLSNVDSLYTQNYTQTSYADISISSGTYYNINYKQLIPTYLNDKYVIVYISGDVYNSNPKGDKFCADLAHDKQALTYCVNSFNDNTDSYIVNFLNVIKTNSNKPVILIGNITGAVLALKYIESGYVDGLIAISPFTNNTNGDSYYHLKTKSQTLEYNHLKEIAHSTLNTNMAQKTFSSFPKAMFVSGNYDVFYSDTIRIANNVEDQNYDVEQNLFEGMFANFIQHETFVETKKLLIDIDEFINDVLGGI